MITRQTDDGVPINDFSTLLAALSLYSRNVCRTKTVKHPVTVVQYPDLTPFRREHSNCWGCVQYTETPFTRLPLIHNDFLDSSKRNFGLKNANKLAHSKASGSPLGRLF